METAIDNQNWSRITRNRGYSAAFVQQATEARARAAKDEQHRHGMARYRGWGMPEWARQIVAECAGRHGVSVADMAGECRTFNVVYARHEAMYLIKDCKPVLSMPKIGGWFNRDHTTVGYALSSHADRNGLPRLSGFDLVGCREKNRLNHIKRKGLS